MAVVQTINGYAIRPRADPDQAGVETEIVYPRKMDVKSPRNNADFPRSASYTYLGEAKESPYHSPPPVISFQGTFSDHDLISSADEAVEISHSESSGATTPDESLQIEPRSHTRRANELAEQLRRIPNTPEQRFRNRDDDASSINSAGTTPSTVRPSLDSTQTTSTTATSTIAHKQRNSISGGFAKAINRTSWYASSQSTTSTSRSPSPSKTDGHFSYDDGNDDSPLPRPSTAVSRAKTVLRRKMSSKSLRGKMGTQTPPESDDTSGLSRRTTILAKKPKHLSGIFKSPAKDNSSAQSPHTPVPSIPFLPKSFSTDKLPMTRSPVGLPARAAPMPRLLSDDRVPTSSVLSPKKKDELWSVFRTLDGDYTKFTSKSLAFKANVVRGSLVPFLHMYATHPSNRKLRPEDLDRRAHILNKWWTGLLEMLHGRNNQSISGTDRPVILEGISGIMERPEWRLSPSLFCPLNERSQDASSSFSKSTGSTTSTSSEFLIESVHLNIRNIFVQNLSAQMAFVVDKMSLRNASASLVTFCGKACAYAFMFVPGMADVLARLWDVQMDTIRRVLAENDIGKFDDVSELADNVTVNFPPALQQLGFSSLMKYMRKLRTPPPLPPGTTNVQWYGHWLDRWTGRESDLFYVFVKHFHILATDFLSPKVTKRERLLAPGVMLVHAQILTNLEATIHRDHSKSHHDTSPADPLPSTHDEVMADPDAVATTLPMPPTNAVRLMAENRLIMLIRDFLSERTGEHPVARQIFAESFNDLLQTAAQGTSVFDHAACYTLLDFLEEALLILVRYEHMSNTQGTLVNSKFWQSVCRKMLSSQNTMTEIRLYAFLYTVWNTVVCDLGRKANLCLGLLLDPEIFESRFNHWCPMIRAYYMRLLCWRVSRYDGEGNPGDVLILETLLVRLQSVWSHYLWLREDAERSGKVPVPTNPCNPAPARRLLIIRTDPQVAPANSFLSFDGIKQSSLQSPPAWRRTSSLSLNSPELDRPDTPRTPDSDSSMESPDLRERGVGGFFRKMLSSKSGTKISDLASPTPTTPTPSSPTSEHPAASPASNPQTPRTHSTAALDQVIKPITPSTHRNFSFRFSLEYHPNNRHGASNIRLLPPRLPLAAQSYLQSHSASLNPARPITPMEPVGDSRGHARYCGRALAEWTVIVGECQGFFERRINEGVPSNRQVETPVLGVEVFKRPS